GASIGVGRIEFAHIPIFQPGSEGRFRKGESLGANDAAEHWAPRDIDRGRVGRFERVRFVRASKLAKSTFTVDPLDGGVRPYAECQAYPKERFADYDPIVRVFTRSPRRARDDDVALDRIIQALDFTTGLPRWIEATRRERRQRHGAGF